MPHFKNCVFERSVSLLFSCLVLAGDLSESKIPGATDQHETRQNLVLCCTNHWAAHNN